MTALLEDETFVARFKRSLTDFTRTRVLTFQAITVLLMAKGMKSLQLSLNEIIPKLGLAEQTVSKVAYSKARRKLKHEAFIELNREAVIRTMYEDDDYRTYRGMRILATDGSKVLLPTNPETEAEFGTVSYHNKQHEAKGMHVYALASVLYDVLNRVALDAQFAPCHSYEVDLAAQALPYIQQNDLVIYDRAYSTYRMLALLSQTAGDYLIRCTDRRFTVATAMLRGEGPDDITVELTPPPRFERNPKHRGLPSTLTVRFVRVTLDNGKYEVLVTSLTDQRTYPAAIFKELYYLRWGIETFYGVLKTRLNLENFSGLSPEAIRQDFYATILLTGIESIFTADADSTLGKQHGGQPKKVNKAVSFNAIKYRAFELFYSKEPRAAVLKQLDELFMASPTLIRTDRKPPRSSASSHTLLQYWRRKRKAVF